MDPVPLVTGKEVQVTGNAPKHRRAQTVANVDVAALKEHLVVKATRSMKGLSSWFVFDPAQLLETAISTVAARKQTKALGSDAQVAATEQTLSIVPAPEKAAVPRGCKTFDTFLQDGIEDIESTIVEAEQNEVEQDEASIRNLDRLCQTRKAIKETQDAITHTLAQIEDLQAQDVKSENFVFEQEGALAREQADLVGVKASVKEIEARIRDKKAEKAAASDYFERMAIQADIDTQYEKLGKARAVVNLKRVSIDTKHKQIASTQHRRRVNELEVEYRQKEIEERQTLMIQLLDVTSDTPAVKQAKSCANLKAIQGQFLTEKQALEQLIHFKVAGFDSLQVMIQGMPQDARLTAREDAAFWAEMAALQAESGDRPFHSQRALALINWHCEKYAKALRVQGKADKALIKAMRDQGIFPKGEQARIVMTKERRLQRLGEFRLNLLNEVRAKFESLIDPEYLTWLKDSQQKLNQEYRTAADTRAELLEGAANADTRSRDLSDHAIMYAKHREPVEVLKCFKGKIEGRWGHIKSFVAGAKVAVKRYILQKQESVVFQARADIAPRQAMLQKTATLRRFGSTLVE